jgi:hypothetical protein
LAPARIFEQRNSAAANHNMEYFQKWNGRVNLAKKEDVGLQLYFVVSVTRFDAK